MAFISSRSLCGLGCKDCIDAGGMETQFQLIQKGNKLFSAEGFSLSPEFDCSEGAAVYVCWCLEWESVERIGEIS